MTCHHNRPELIDLQYNAFKLLLEDEYELIVFNDAASPQHEMAIRTTCERLGILSIRYEQNWHNTDPLNQTIKNWLEDPRNISSANPGLCINSESLESIGQSPSVRHCHVLQFALDSFGYNYDGPVMVVDSDLIPIRSLSIEKLLEKHPLVGLKKYWWFDQIEYLWAPFIAFDPKRVPDVEDLRFHVDIINNKLFDTGAHTYHYLNRHPDLSVKMYAPSNNIDSFHLSFSELKEQGYTRSEAALIKSLPWPLTLEFVVDNHFLHFGGASFDEWFQLKFNLVSLFIQQLFLTKTLPEME